MKSLSLLLYFSLLITTIISAQSNAAEQVQPNDVYIVYMGGKNSANVRTRDDHSQLVSSLAKRNAVVHVYKHGFLGFAARLSKEEADLISQKPSVVSVFPNQIALLQTTHSWSFLKYQTVQRQMLGLMPASRSTTKGSDTVIGILDSGIWPESESFNDKSMGPIPKWWKGTCMEGANFTTANCNRKIVGARWYGSQITSTRDSQGHGTHVSSTAAGVAVHNVSYYGLARGTTIGGSPGARIAMYTVCSDGCAGADILAAIDDAIADGVHILSLSLGYGYARDFLEDSIAIGTFHAMENGILVVCAGGNSGPGNGSVVNDAPWIFTVAASTIDRDLQSNVVLGDKKLVKGGGLNFSGLKKSPIYTLKFDYIANGTTNSTYAGKNCHPDQLDKNKVKGNIILCNHDDGNEDYSVSSKAYAIKQLGGLGAIFIDEDNRVAPFNFLDYPMTSVSSTDGKEIISYIKSSRKPTATILPTKAVLNHKPAPIIPKFSGRGPSSIVKNLLKPDITAPGVNIIAAWRENDKEMTLPGRESPVFSIISGTSMATPHISGIAALVKSHHPAWTPSAIRSAIMTTALQTNNVGAPIITTFEKAATPYDYGAGEVSNIEPLQPGLVYETETTDYLYFLCNYGYNLTTIKRIASKLPDGFSCSEDSSVELIANLNYPSILISGLTGSRNVTRTVTNVGQEEATYIVKIDAPSSLLDVKVVPDKLHFTKKNKRLSYTVTLKSHLSDPSEDIFGSITWSNGEIKVRSPIVVSKKDEDF